MIIYFACFVLLYCCNLLVVYNNFDVLLLYVFGVDGRWVDLQALELQ